MEKKRKVYAPFSLTSEAGVTQTPVEGYIDVNQVIYPTVNTGTINENGKWAGVKSDDTEFFAITTALGVANGGEFLCPDTPDHPSLDMTGFRDLFIAFRPTEGGGSGYNILAVMGPDTERFANLSPVASGAILRGNNSQASPADFETLFLEGAQTMTANKWNVFSIFEILRGYKNLQFKITNNTGAQSDVEVAFMRLV